MNRAYLFALVPAVFLYMLYSLSVQQRNSFGESAASQQKPCPENNYPTNFQSSKVIEKPSFSLPAYGIRGPVRWKSLNKPLQNEYTMNGSVGLSMGYYFMDHSGFPETVDYPPTVHPVWKKQELEEKLGRASRREQEDMTGYGYPAPRDIYSAFDAHPVKDKTVLVIGSLNPWIECIALAYGKAKAVYTVDFNKPVAELPQFHTLSIPELEQLNMKFDVIVSFSSLEHDGLGRYGDELNPNGDLMRMKIIKNFIKPTGLFYLSVPVGHDHLVFNERRIYGPKRYLLLTEGWEPIGYYDPGAYPKNYYDAGHETGQPVVVPGNVVAFRDKPDLHSQDSAG